MPKTGRYGKYHRMHDVEIATISTMFKLGNTIREIGRITGIPFPTIAYHMRKLHPEVERSKGGRPTHRNVQK